MVNYSTVLNAVKKFIDYDMIPKSSGNQRIILRMCSTAMSMSPDKIWEKIKDNGTINMFNIVDGDMLDLDSLESILVSGLGDNEFEFGFRLLGMNYKFYLNAEDIRKIKSYSGGI